MLQPFAVALSFGDRGLRGRQLLVRCAPGPMRRRYDVRVGAGIGVEQRAMSGRREQPAIVMLAMDFDKMGPNLTEQRSRAGLVVQEGAAPAIGLHAATDQQRLTRFQANLVFRKQRSKRRTGCGRRETCRHLRLVGALPDQPAVGTHAQREPQRVEQDRLAGARLTRQHTKPRVEIEVEPFDQNDIGNGQGGQHRASLPQNKMQIYSCEQGADAQALGACFRIRSYARLYHLLPG